MPLRSSLALALTIAALLLPGCADPAEVVAEHRAALAAGDERAAQEALRDGLERHPEDLELLLAAADFYLRPDAPEQYKPRLSLHYAMRADKAAGYTDERATAAMVRAHRGAGGFAETDALVREGLAGLNHPDAEAPTAVRPVDPDLLEPTLPNVLEQKKRWEEGRLEPTCDEPLELFFGGEFEADPGEAEVPADGSVLRFPPFCYEPSSRPAAIPCATLELRECNTAELWVLGGPIRNLLRGDPDGPRCCADPVQRRVKRDASGEVVVAPGSP